MKDLLCGAYDLHVHTSPDVTQRKCDDTELAQRLTAAGMAGCSIKCHFNDTAARAILLQKQFPQLDVVGGVTLNRAVGGINPYAAESSARIGGKMLWFPTLDSLSYQKFMAKDDSKNEYSSFLSACDAKGRLINATLDVLDVAQEFGMIVATGHLAPHEGMQIASESARRGIQCIITHADNPANKYSPEQMGEMVRLGVIIEFSFFTIYYNRTRIEDIASHIKLLGAENIVLSSDVGQMASPYSDEGMALFATQLLDNGVSEKDIKQMICSTPKRLIA